MTEASQSARPTGVNTRLLRKAVQERALGIPAADVALGRFVVLERLGRGGMGDVFAAYDANLDRRVAVKVLRHVVHDPDDRRHRRLEREARAMAKLSHPNVVTVHEVGVHEHRLFLVMEYVDGGTLYEWCAENPPAGGERFDTALHLMRDVAAGLVAAHEAGLVHRDLKPHNVLLQPSRSGPPRAMVGDFGLARSGLTTGSGAESADSSSARVPRTPDDEPRSTHSGAAVGTPAYMAPEQFDGRADERSDQFGLCATFHEVFYGVRHSSGERPTVSVPAWLERILARGLAEAPSERFSSVGALLAALERNRRPRRRALLVAGSALAGAAALAAVVLSGERSVASAPCDDGSARLEPAVGAARKAEIRAAFEASGEPYWAQAWERLDARLDRYAGQWRAAHLDACEATVVRKVQSEQARRSRVTCLEHLLEGLELTTAAFAMATPELVSDAESISLALPPPRQCADSKELQFRAGRSLADPEVAATAAALRRARTQGLLGRDDDAEVAAAEAARRAEELDIPGLQADALLLQAKLAFRQGDWERSEARGLDALAVAEGSSNVDRMAEAWNQLSNVAHRQERRDAAIFRAERAVSLADGAGLDAGRRGQILATQATVLAGTVPAQQVIALREQALDLLRRYGAAETVVEAVSIDLVGDLATAGRPKEALALGHRLLADSRERLSDAHPTQIALLGQLAQILSQTGEQDEALRFVERALASFPDDPRWNVEQRLGLISLRAGILIQMLRHQQAQRAMEELLRFADGLVPDDHWEVTGARMQLAAVALELDDPVAALAQLEALDGYGSDERVHAFNRAAYWGNLADARVRTGSISEGLEDLERARELYATGGEQSTWMFLFMVHAARTLELAGERERSVLEYERALSIGEVTAVDPTELADARFGLARGIAGSDRRRARTLAEQARDHYASQGGAGQATREQIDQWLMALK